MLRIRPVAVIAAEESVVVGVGKLLVIPVVAGVRVAITVKSETQMF